MKKYFIFLFLSLITISTNGQLLKGKVIFVADGDTFTLLSEENTQIKIRLHGIDCPERSQPYSKVATDFVKVRILKQPVKVQVKDTDRYGRTVGEVFYQDTINLNIELLKNGLAWHYKYYDKSAEYSLAESEAKKRKSGLWIDENPVAPWDYRKVK